MNLSRASFLMDELVNALPSIINRHINLMFDVANEWKRLCSVREFIHFASIRSFC